MGGESRGRGWLCKGAHQLLVERGRTASTRGRDSFQIPSRPGLQGRSLLVCTWGWWERREGTHLHFHGLTASPKPPRGTGDC